MVKCYIVDRWNIRQFTKAEKKRSLGMSEADKNFSMKDLVQASGVSRQQVNNILNNKREASLEVALKMYNYLYDIGFDFLRFEDCFDIE